MFPALSGKLRFFKDSHCKPADAGKLTLFIFHFDIPYLRVFSKMQGSCCSINKPGSYRTDMVCIDLLTNNVKGVTVNAVGCSNASDSFSKSN